MGVWGALVQAGGVGAIGATALVSQLSGGNSIPDRAAEVYIAAAHDAPCPIDYRYLAGIGMKEYGHGTHGGGQLDGNGIPSVQDASYAGAVGPMQFMPDTFAEYGVDGDGDGVIDVWDEDDAVASAANLLCASHINENVHDALWRYNQSESYIQDVIDYANTLPPDDGSVAPAAAAAPAPATPGAPPAPAAPPPSTTTTINEGRLCGIQEWLQEKSDCFPDAKAHAAWLWSQFGDDLNQADTQRLYGLWKLANGVPKPPPTTTTAAPPPAPAPAGPPQAGAPPAAPAPDQQSPHLDGDYPGLPGSAGMDSGFAASLAQMVADSGGTLSINQGYRDPGEALQKWQDALAKYGSESEANQWVAKTVTDADGNIICGSFHCKGLAADLSFADDYAIDWAHQHAGDYGLVFPLDNENWHIEPISARAV